MPTDTPGGEPARLSEAERHRKNAEAALFRISGSPPPGYTDPVLALCTIADWQHAELAQQRAELDQLRRVEVAARRMDAYFVDITGDCPICRECVQSEHHLEAASHLEGGCSYLELRAALADRPALEERPTHGP